MHDGNWIFWGLHTFWWLLWLALIAALLYPLALHLRGRRETPLQLLQRRYAAGEISTEEYEERKARLERDARLSG